MSGYPGLTAALRKLPIVDGNEKHLGGIELKLALAWGIGRTENKIGRQQRGTTASIRALGEFAKALVKTNNMLHRLPLEAQEALHVEKKALDVRKAERKLAGGFSWQDDLPELLYFDALVVNVAHAALRAAAALEAAPPSIGHKPAKEGAAIVSKFALEAYELLTGKSATISTTAHKVQNRAGGPFMDFLKDVFNALGIEASVESQARAAIRAARAKEKTPAKSG